MPHVLVVEDHPDTARALVVALERNGYRVTHARNGQEALYVVSMERPDAVVLDLLLPVVDGLAFARLLRSYLRWRDLPVVVVTALDEGPELHEVRRAGVAAMFHKPNYDLAEMITAVRRVAPPLAGSP